MDKTIPHITRGVKAIDYTLVEEYLDGKMADDPAMLMNGITALYKDVAAHFRPAGRKYSCYSRKSVREAIQTYYDEHNVHPKIAVQIHAREHIADLHAAEMNMKRNAACKAAWNNDERRKKCSERMKRIWSERRAAGVKINCSRMRSKPVSGVEKYISIDSTNKGSNIISKQINVTDEMYI